jgi:hypothetical protein
MVLTRKMINVWALDPGGFTGFLSCVVPTDDDRLRWSAVESLAKSRSLGMTFGHEIKADRWQEHVDQILKGMRQGWDYVKAKSSETGYDGCGQVCIIEGFAGSEAVHTYDVWSPVRIESCLSYLLPVVIPGCTVVIQDPSRKGQITDARLKAWGWYRAGCPHFNDAARHLFVYLRGLGVRS